ncbi:lipopolysaccharide biosynthesis protein [Kluyvera sichuanensis]|uniref:lipopolysaccharide biosynthesis protein n=1 Tax=Kluyvera sichuanensis TaxID=2725494 RepID=UPI003F6639F5
MSYKKNIVASYFSQIYVSTIGIIILPLYIKYMGAEVYGLIGFFAMLQSLFGLLDLGLTPTIARETARYNGGTMSALDYRKLVRALHFLFISVALIGGMLIFSLSSVITTKWLHVTSIPLDTVIYCVKVMAISVSLRWLAGLYRGIITGNEKLDWLSYANIFTTTLRFVGVFIAMEIEGYTPLVFFTYQFVIAIVECFLLYILSKILTPHIKSTQRLYNFSFKPIFPVLKFSLSVAFTSSVWILITQSDKFILSGILSLEVYGHFSIAALAASGIMLLSAPITSATMPLLTRLNAENKQDDMLALYGKSTQFVCVFSCTAAIVIFFCAKPLLYAWTGDNNVVLQSSDILRYYSLGYGFLSLSAFPYYLQYAKGNIKYHSIGNLIMLFSLLPSIAYAAKNYGAVGAGFAWFATNCLFFIFWVSYVHSKIIPGKHKHWLLNHCIVIIAPSIMINYFISKVEIKLDGRIENIFYVAVVSLISLSVAFISSSFCRQYILSKIKWKSNV